MRKTIKFICILATLFISASTVLAQQNEEKDLNAEISLIPKDPDLFQKRFLVSITPPVGYASWLGTVFNTAPVALEIPVHARIGVRVETSLVYYLSRFQSYAVIFTMPIYLEKSDGQKPYHGFYVGPYFGWGGKIQPEITSRLGGGVEVGYSWAYENSMQFSLGLMRGSQGGTGLSLALGKWF